jgi:NAD(P)-dependent dehydrogenase (short-subunit alcohol dehydrogenase family)
MRLANKAVLISGGASGIGRSIAEVFLGEGASVVISDINAAMLEETVLSLSTLGPVRGIVGDVRQMSAGATMVQETVDTYGAIDILVCNAGITSVMPIEQLDEDEWDAVMNTNVKGIYTLIKAAIPFMKNQGGGKIVTVGSEMGIVAVPESPAYNASKGAVIMFTKSIAIDLIRYNIRVNSLCPGITQTPLLQAEVDNSIDPAATATAQAVWAPIMRVANPREIAQGALFLASDESSFAVGSCLVLDGGYTAR